MKKAIIAILTISIFCAAFSVKTRAYVGAPPNDWLNLYQNYLEGFLTDNFESYDKENIGIRLIYLDDDSIPELCCIYQNNSDGLVLFTIKDGEVSELCDETHQGFYSSYIERSGLIKFDGSAGGGSSWEQICRLEDGELKEAGTYHFLYENLDEGKDREYYWWNDEQMSETSARKKMEKLYDSDKATVLVGEYSAGEPAISYDRFMSDEMEKTWDPAGFFWLEDTDPNSRKDGNIWKYRKTVRRINEDSAPSKDLSVSGRKLVLSDNSIYEIYENPDTGEVNKVTVIREYWDKNGNSESFRQRSDYYYFNGLPNFEFIREDSSRPMSFPTHSQLGERIYFDRKGGFCRSVLYDEKGCHENTGSSSDDDGKWADMVIAYALGKDETG